MNLAGDIDDTLPFAIEPEKSLPPKLEAKLAAFAEILGTTLDEAAQDAYARMLAALPNKPERSYLLPNLDIASCERIEDDLIRLELKTGRAYFGQRSEKKQYLLHQLFSRRLPEIVDGDAYKLALDVQRRYYGIGLPWFLSQGGTCIEGGCYTGIKAIRWCDRSKKPLRVIAVEMGRTNFELLQRNIGANGLTGTIVPVHAGLWRTSGEGVQQHAFTTRRFLETTDRWSGHMRHTEKVRLVTLDHLLDEQHVEVADLVNIQVNGAEIEVLEGFRRTIDRVKVLLIAAYYSRDGVRNVDVVRAKLEGMGCTTVFETSVGLIAAATPRFKDEILARRPPPKGAEV